MKKASPIIISVLLYYIVIATSKALLELNITGYYLECITEDIEKLSCVYISIINRTVRM